GARPGQDVGRHGRLRIAARDRRQRGEAGLGGAQLGVERVAPLRGAERLPQLQHFGASRAGGRERDVAAAWGLRPAPGGGGRRPLQLGLERRHRSCLGDAGALGAQPGDVGGERARSATSLLRPATPSPILVAANPTAARSVMPSAISQIAQAATPVVWCWSRQNCAAALGSTIARRSMTRPSAASRAAASAVWPNEAANRVLPVSPTTASATAATLSAPATM